MTLSRGVSDRPAGPVPTPWAWLALIMIVLVAAALRWQLLDVPLERDEGEYAYAGQLLMEGTPPFAVAYNMKMPGIYAAYAGIMSVFGETIRGIHLGLLLVNALSTVLLFLLARRLTSGFGATAAAAVFALMSMSANVQGVFAHAEHFVVLAAIGGLLLLERHADSGQRGGLFAGALLLGIGFLMKQHGAAFIAFGGIMLLARAVRTGSLLRAPMASDVAIYVAAAVLPFVAVCGLMLKAGTFDRFWFWTIDYAGAYVSLQPVRAGMGALASQLSSMMISQAAAWVLAVSGLLVTVFNPPRPGSRLYLLLFLLFSFLAIMPGFYFRPHYFVMLLPAVALLAGVGAEFMRSRLEQAGRTNRSSGLLVIVVTLIVASSVWQQRDYLFAAPEVVSRQLYGYNPFPESIEIARYIRDHSRPTDRVGILGSEPQILFYANRRSATGFIYTYPLMEPQPYALEMQQQMVAEIEAARPEFLVFVGIHTSWLMGEHSNPYVFEWFETYADSNYTQVGVVNLWPEGTRYAWDEAARNAQQESPFVVLVFRRNS